MSDKTVRLYLLGALPDSHAAALEERYFTEPAFLSLVKREELRLIRDYLQGELTSEENQRFKTAYLARPDRLPAIEVVRAELKATRSRTSSAFAWNLLRAGAVLAVLVCAVGLGLWYRSASRPAPQPTVARNLPQAAPPWLDVHLEPGVNKGPGRAVSIKLPLSVPGVHFDLELPGQTLQPGALGKLYIVESNGNFRLVLQSPAVPSASGHFTVSMESSSLIPGDYVIELAADGAAVQKYTFSTR